MKQLNFETVLIQGVFHFEGNHESKFRGPITKGFRPIVWIDSINKSTSCSFISDGEIFQGQRKEVNIVILNQLALDRMITEGAILNIGSIKHKIGELIVNKHLGFWRGDKLP